MLKTIIAVALGASLSMSAAASASTMPTPDTPAGQMLRNFRGMPVAGPVTPVPGDGKNSSHGSHEDLGERKDESDHHARHEKRTHKKDHHRKGGDDRED